MLQEAAAIIQSHVYKVEPHISKVAWLLQLERHAKGNGHVAAGSTTTDKAAIAVLVPECITPIEETQIPSSRPFKPSAKYRVPTSLYYNSLRGTGIVTRHQAKQKRMYEENYLKKALGIDEDDHIPDAYKLCNMIEPVNLPAACARKAYSTGSVVAASRKHRHSSKQSHDSDASARKQPNHQNSLLVDIPSLPRADAPRRVDHNQDSAQARAIASEVIKPDDIVARPSKKERTPMVSPSIKTSRLDNNSFKVTLPPILLPVTQRHGLARKPIVDITDIWKKPPIVKHQIQDKQPERFNDTSTVCRAPNTDYSLNIQKEDIKYQQQDSSNTHGEGQMQDKPAIPPNNVKITDISDAEETHGKVISQIAMPTQYDPARLSFLKRQTTDAMSPEGRAYATVSPFCPLVVERIGWPNAQGTIPLWHNGRPLQSFPRRDESSSIDIEQAWRKQQAKNVLYTDRRVFINKSKMEICVSFNKKRCESDDKLSDTSTSTSDTYEGRPNNTKQPKRGRGPRTYKRHSQILLPCYCHQNRKQNKAIKMGTKPNKSSVINLVFNGQDGVERGLLKTVLRQKSPERKRNYARTDCAMALETGVKRTHPKQTNNQTYGQDKQEEKPISDSTTHIHKLSATCTGVRRVKKTNSNTSRSLVESFALSNVYPVTHRTIQKRQYTRHPISGLVCDSRRNTASRRQSRPPADGMLTAIARLTQVCQEQAREMDQPRTKPTKKQPYHVGGNKTKKRTDGYLSYSVGLGKHVRPSAVATLCNTQRTTTPVRTLTDRTSVFKRTGSIPRRENITKYDDIYTKVKALVAGSNNNSNCIVHARESDIGQYTALIDGNKGSYKLRKRKNDVAYARITNKGRNKNGIPQKLSPASLNAFVSLEDICCPSFTSVVKPKAKPIKRLTCSPLVSSKTKVAKKSYVSASIASVQRLKSSAQKYHPKMDLKPNTKINTPKKQGSPETHRKQVFLGDVRKSKHRDLSPSKNMKPRPKHYLFIAPEIRRKTITGQNANNKYPIKNTTSMQQTQLGDTSPQAIRRSQIKKIVNTQQTKLKEASSQTIRRRPITPSCSQQNSRQKLFEEDYHADKTNAKNPRITASGEYKKRESIRDRCSSHQHSVRRCEQKHGSNAFYRLLASTKYVSHGIHAAGSAFQQLVPAKCRTKHCRNAAEVLALSPLARPPPKMQPMVSSTVSASRRSQYVDMKHSYRKDEGGALSGLVLSDGGGGGGGNVTGERGDKVHNTWSFWSPSVSKQNTAIDLTSNPPASRNSSSSFLSPMLAKVQLWKTWAFNKLISLPSARSVCDDDQTCPPHTPWKMKSPSHTSSRCCSHTRRSSSVAKYNDHRNICPPKNATTSGLKSPSFGQRRPATSHGGSVKATYSKIRGHERSNHGGGYATDESPDCKKMCLNR